MTVHSLERALARTLDGALRHRGHVLAAASALFLAAGMVSCSGDERPGDPDGGGRVRGDGGLGSLADGQTGDAESARAECREQTIVDCACERDTLCCGGQWDRLCDATAEAFGCGSCDPNGPNGPGDPGYFDPDYRPPAADAGSDGGGLADGGTFMCVDYRIDTEPSRPDVLVVLDRSGSMRQGTVDRWGPSVRAVQELSRSLSSSLRVGLMTFPGDCSTLTDALARTNCELGANSFFGNLSCEPGQIKVAPALQSADAITAQLGPMAPGGATPTAATLQAAQASLQGMSVPASNQIVLLVTDGAPNCAGGNIAGLGAVGTGSASGQPEAVTQTVAAIDSMRTVGIRTYVLGYDTARDAELSSSLDRMAVAGGTGDTKYHPVEDQMSLQTSLLAITSQAAECTVLLTTPLVAPATIEVKLDGTLLSQDDANGYKLSPDLATLTLQGDACTTYRTGDRHVLFVKAVCPQDVPTDGGDAGAGAGDAGDDDAGIILVR